MTAPATLLRRRQMAATAALLKRRQMAATAACNASAITHELTDSEAIDMLNQLHCGDRRGDFAKAIFPYDRARYGRRSQWAKEVGKRVAGDIRNNADLRLALERTGYEPGKVGYTLEQRIILIKFYKTR